MKTLLWITFCLFIIFPFMFLVGSMIMEGVRSAVSKEERMECLQWSQQAQDYELYYSLQWQKDQCKAQGMELLK